MTTPDQPPPLTPLQAVTMPRVVADADVLTEKWWPVVIGLSRDLDLHQIAKELGLSHGAVRSRAVHIREALGVHTAQGVVAECFRRGWLR